MVAVVFPTNCAISLTDIDVWCNICRASCCILRSFLVGIDALIVVEHRCSPENPSPDWESVWISSGSQLVLKQLTCQFGDLF